MAAQQGPGVPDWGDAIDPATFDQILEMDDDDDREFSKNIVLDFFPQAGTTFQEMQEAIDNADLGALSSLGHFLKGSSATLGLTKVQASCEKIQHLGAGRNEKGEETSMTKDAALDRIKQIFPRLQTDYQDAERRLKDFFKI